ncbi:MAG: hypothetical protein AAFW89_04470 [Bacteroidota bacterium]
MEPIHYEDVAEFIAKFSRERTRKHPVRPETWIEQDLHIMGEDAIGLLIQAEEYFGISWPEGDGFRKLFNIDEHEYLFGSEGLDPIGVFYWGEYKFRKMRGIPEPKYLDLRVSEFYRAIRTLHDEMRW